MKILVLGDGLLGKELCKQTGWDCISRKKDGFDITKPYTFYKFFTEQEQGVITYKKYDCIVNCIANTDTYSDDKESHWNVNYKGVADLVDFCNQAGIKLVQISTDHVYVNSKPEASEEDVPVHDNNWYGYTKLVADAYVQLKSKSYLLLRESHKPCPFPYPKVWRDQFTNGDYVHNIVKLIVRLIEIDAAGVYNVGTYLKTWWDLVRKDHHNVSPIRKPAHIPADITMNINKMSNAIREINQ